MLNNAVHISDKFRHSVIAVGGIALPMTPQIRDNHAIIRSKMINLKLKGFCRACETMLKENGLLDILRPHINHTKGLIAGSNNRNIDTIKVKVIKKSSA